MAVNLASKVEVYAEKATHLLTYEEWYDVSNAFVWRDAIHDLLRAGEPLDDNRRQMLDAADVSLLHQRHDIVAKFPEIFCDRAPDEYWWWHLDDDDVLRAHAPQFEIISPASR